MEKVMATMLSRKRRDVETLPRGDRAQIFGIYLFVRSICPLFPAFAASLPISLRLS